MDLMEAFKKLNKVSLSLVVVLLFGSLNGKSQSSKRHHVSVNPVLDGLRLGYGQTYQNKFGLYMYHTIRHTAEDQLSKQYGSNFLFQSSEEISNIMEYQGTLHARYYFNIEQNWQTFTYLGASYRNIDFDINSGGGDVFFDERFIEPVFFKQRLHANSMGILFGGGGRYESASGIFFGGNLGVYVPGVSGSGNDRLWTNDRMLLTIQTYGEVPKLQVKLEIGYTFR